MGTGLIVAFVVTVWAAYFVPLALRRYDEAHLNSALEVLTPLSRVIRRAPAMDVREESEPQRPASRPARPAGHTRSSARLAARRRLRVLLTILVANAVVGGLAGFSVIPFWSIAISFGLLAAWLVACRIQVRSEYGIATPRAPRERVEREHKVRIPKPNLSRLARSAVVPDEDTVTVFADGLVADDDPMRKHVMENVPLEDDALDEKLVIAVPSVASHGELVWDPLPVTLPTYVTKPRAGRTVRTIDFNAPGVWTSGHVEGEETEMPAAEADDASVDAQRRAAGE